MNIESPEDADGREIPFDTEVPYDGYGLKNLVKSSTYAIRTGTCTGIRRAKSTSGASSFAVSDMHPAGPDSREKPDEDLHAGSSGLAEIPPTSRTRRAPTRAISVGSAPNASSTQGIVPSTCVKTSRLASMG